MQNFAFKLKLLLLAPMTPTIAMGFVFLLAVQ